MILYRDHRGLLVDSMETAQEFETYEQMADYIKKSFQEFGDDGKGHVTCEHYCYDDRIDWETWIVTYNGMAVGFTNGDPNGH